MNNAFVRESDADVRHCPFCGSLGQAVGRVTLDAWLKLRVAQLASSCVRSIGNPGEDVQRPLDAHSECRANSLFPMPSAHSLKQAVPPDDLEMRHAEQRFDAWEIAR